MSDDTPMMRRARAHALGIPNPLPLYDDGAACPWCGELHETITFGENLCLFCKKVFIFSCPPWLTDDSEGRFFTWVHLTSADNEMLMRNPDALPPFKPNKRLQNLYFELRAEKLTRGRA